MQNNQVSKVNWGLRIFLLFLLFIVFSISNLILKEYIQGPMRAAAMTRAQQAGAVNNIAAEHASKSSAMIAGLYVMAGLMALVIISKTKKTTTNTNNNTTNTNTNRSDYKYEHNINTNTSNNTDKSNYKTEHNINTPIASKTKGGGAMRLGDFGITIPEGRENSSGYVVMNHNSQYCLILYNNGDRRCDAEVKIDGKLVGIWRLPALSKITIERPVNDHGKFTFYKYGTPESSVAGLTIGEPLGLISVLFKPEVIYQQKESDYIGVRYSKREYGGTGLSGQSDQKFNEVAPLNYDESGFVQIHLRLICESNTPRPLKGLSTSIPPMV